MKKKIYVIIILLIASAYGVSSSMASGGHIFFSPNSLKCKSHREILLFLTSVPIYKSSNKTFEYELTTYLKEKEYWKPIEGGDPLWISASHWNEQWRDGQARFHKELSWRGKEWIEWTEKHPNIAKVFWPKVLQELRTNREEFIYFMAARDCTSLEQYKETLTLLTEPASEPD